MVETSGDDEITVTHEIMSFGLGNTHDEFTIMEPFII